ncbi:MAG: Rieske 2Fe-2S domain-containing protein [Pyrinomonadaceae bacterium]
MKSIIVKSNLFQGVDSPLNSWKEPTPLKSNPTVGLDMTRRKFCSRLLVTLSALMLAARKLIARPSSQRGFQLAYPPMKIQDAERLMPGSYLNFVYPSANDPAILVRGDDGEYFAHSRRCAHLGCSVDFDSARRCLDCPCHHGAYDPKSGAVLYGPPTKSLEPIILQLRTGGEVWATGKGISNSRPAT